ncbi:MAG: serine hydrolase domain-containing protein [Ginsengibacter sp.]
MHLKTIGSLILTPVLFSLSCHSGASKNNKKVNGDTIVYKAPVPGVISDQEKQHYQNEVQDFYNKRLARSGFNGALLVAKKGNIIFEKYAGYENIHKKDTQINEHSAFHRASMSKTFTAMAVLKLMEQKKLDLNDNVKKYLPSFPYDGVTVKMLLNHRSALPNYVYFMQTLGWDTHKYITNQDILDYMAKFKPPFVGRPGTHFKYCNTKYALLAMIIEKASGKSYPQYLQTTFFKPLQMTDTYVFALADTASAMPSFDYRGRNERFNFLDGGYGDKNIYSSAKDILKWDQALYSGELFSQKTLDSAFTPYSNEKPGIKNYGLGWRMNIYPTGKKIVFHTGWWHGNNTILVRLIADSATIIALGNKYNRGVYDSKKLANIFEPYFQTDEKEINEASANTEGETTAAEVPKKQVIIKHRTAIHHSKKKRRK